MTDKLLLSLSLPQMSHCDCHSHHLLVLMADKVVGLTLGGLYCPPVTGGFQR